MRALIGSIALGVFAVIGTGAWASVSVTVNGTSYTIPQKNEKGWGDNVTAWIQAISANTLYPTGGLFSLSSELDLGPSFGIKSVYFKTRTASPSLNGTLRLANTDSIGWRNSGNTADLLLTTGATDGILNYNGTPLVLTTATQTLSNKTLTAPVISSISNTGTLTLPTSTDTLIGRATTDTLTNKTISGASNTLSNIPNSATTATNLNTASTIVARDGSGNFSAGTITAALTGTASGNVPNSLFTTKGDLAVYNGSSVVRQAVGADGTVLSADSTQSTGFRFISPLTNPMTGVGDLIIGGASGAATRLASGAGRQVITGQGSGVAPIFQGGLGAIQSKTANYTVLATDGFLIGDATSAAFTFTLPTGGSTLTGVPFWFKKKDSDTTFNAITITDGTFSTTLNTSGESVLVSWTGSAYEILDHRVPGTTAVDSNFSLSAGFGTVTGQSISRTRSGDTLVVYGTFAAGTTAASVAYLQLPTGLTIDYTKLGTSQMRIGEFASGASSTQTVSGAAFEGPVFTDGSTTNQVFFAQFTTTSGLVKAFGSECATTGKLFTFTFQLPIVGWKG